MDDNPLMAIFCMLMAGILITFGVATYIVLANSWVWDAPHIVMISSAGAFIFGLLGVAGSGN